MELWNAYINTRLNALGLYLPSSKTCIGTLNGSIQMFPPSTESALMAHMSVLEREGFSFIRAIVADVILSDRRCFPPNRRRAYA